MIISNFLSHLKNNIILKKYKIKYIKSKKIINLLNILIQEGYINTFKIVNNDIYIYIKNQNNKKILNNIIQISKSGKKVYIKNKQLFLLKNGFYIISTPIGFLSLNQAKKLNYGGELICKII